MTLHDHLTNRLKSGGWALRRQGKHELWAHPNGQVFCLSVMPKDTGRKRQNYLKEIEQKERA